MNEKRYTHVIWDFNGTILNDVRLGISCTNRMLAERGLAVIPNEETYREIFGFPIDDYYSRLGFDFEKEDYDTVLAPQWVAMYLAGEPTCPMNDGVESTIAAVADLGIPQVLLSATKEEQLRAQLARLGITESFSEILGLDNIHARSKRHVAEAWMVRNPEARPLFIGDTEHDADVARSVGADCVLFTGGHQSAARLAGCGFPLIESIDRLLNYLD
jgi:phosphoglycolate phosphatase